MVARLPTGHAAKVALLVPSIVAVPRIVALVVPSIATQTAAANAHLLRRVRISRGRRTGASRGMAAAGIGKPARVRRTKA